MLKPKAVEFRISLWNLFYKLSDKNKVPQSGLNFLIDAKLDRDFKMGRSDFWSTSEKILIKLCNPQFFSRKPA